MWRRTTVLLSFMTAMSLYAGALGDWTNFMYITTFGASQYWLAQDAPFAGGAGSNAFNHPQGVLAGASNVFVIDTGNDRVVKLGFQKTTVLTPEPSNFWQISYVGEWGASGTASNEFRFPTDATFGPRGELFIVDCSNNCIKFTDSAGTFLGAFGTLGGQTNQFRQPKGICSVVQTNVTLVISNTVGLQAVVTTTVSEVRFRVVIADSGNNRVVEYLIGSNGWEFVRAVSNIVNYPPDGLAKQLNEIWGPYDVVVIGTNLYITEAGRNQSSDYINARRLKGANNCNRFIMLDYSNWYYADDWNIPETSNGVAFGGFTGNVYQGIRGLIDFDGFLLVACADNSQSQYLITDDRGYIAGKFGTGVLGGSVTPSPLPDKFGYPYNLTKVGAFVFCADAGNNRVSMWKKNALPVFDYPKTNYFKVRELQVLSFTVHAKDDDGDAITYGGTLDPATDGKNWGVNGDYFKFSMIPYRGSAGTVYTLTLTASDGAGTATLPVTIEVQPLNTKHKKLTKLPKAGQYQAYYEDWVYPAPGTGNLPDDGDLIALKVKKGAVINHWDGSVLDVSSTPRVSVAARRAKGLVGIGYDGLYGEVDATNEYAKATVAQLDVIAAGEPLKSIGVAGSLGRGLLPTAQALGTVVVKSGCLGGADAGTIKSLTVAGKKVKLLNKRLVGGAISCRYYPGMFARVRAYAGDKKSTSITKIAASGGDITDVWIHAAGHIKSVAVKPGKDELKLPVGGALRGSIVRAGVAPATLVMQPTGDIAKVQATMGIFDSALIAAADPGTGTFVGTALDPTEQYVGSIKDIAVGKGATISNSLIVTKKPIKKLVKLPIDPSTQVIVDGVVQ